MPCPMQAQSKGVAPRHVHFICVFAADCVGVAQPAHTAHLGGSVYRCLPIFPSMFARIGRGGALLAYSPGPVHTIGGLLFTSTRGTQGLDTQEGQRVVALGV